MLNIVEVLQVARHLAQFLYLCFHFSIGVFLAVQIARNKPMFRRGFYILYTVQTFFDSSIYLVAASGRFTYYTGISPDFFNHSVWGVLFHFGIGFCIIFQQCCHASIAFNRFSAFKYLQLHDKLWKRRHLTIMILTSVAVSFLANVPRLFADPFALHLVDSFSVINLHQSSYTATNLLMTIVIFCTTASCFVLEMRALVMYRALPAIIRRKYGDDIRLLVYAFIQLFVQVLLATDYLILLVCASGTDLALLALTVYPYLNTLLAISSSTCLLVTSRLVRESYLQALVCCHLPEPTKVHDHRQTVATTPPS